VETRNQSWRFKHSSAKAKVSPQTASQLIQSVKTKPSKPKEEKLIPAQ
jgi:hypothetical protein